MPYVALAPATRRSRSAVAEARWAAIVGERPDLEPAVALQRNLLGLVSDLADLIDRGRLPRLSLPPRYLAAKLNQGIPALAGEPIPVPTPILTPFLLGVCEALAEGGAGDAARRISSHIDETRMDAGSLLSASLKRDQKAIRTAAVHRGLAPDLLWLVAELAVSPYVHALQQVLFGAPPAGTPLASALDAWDRGYCPFCGSWPALAEVASGRRMLRCSFCALAWELQGYRCIYCREAGEAFVTAAPGDERKDQRLELCGTCRSYMKAVDVATLSPFPLLAIADLETMHLDMVAMERGYGRPVLEEFAAR